MRKNKATTFSLTNLSKDKLPRLPFLKMKETVLGKKYELSLVFVTNSLSKKLNRQKNKATDILSFTLGKKTGEIFISQKAAKAEAPKFNQKLSPFIARLFIHGLFHLKGFEHGSTMEYQERQVGRKFGINGEVPINPPERLQRFSRAGKKQ